MVWAPTPEDTAESDVPRLGEPQAAVPGNEFRRHWKWMFPRVTISGLVMAAVLVGSILVLHRGAWLVLLGLIFLAPFVYLVSWIVWRAFKIKIEPDKIVVTQGIIRTRRIDIPILNIQDFELVYRSDIDRVLFHCVELRVATAAEQPNTDLYPIDTRDATAIMLFLDMSRRERPSDPAIRLQRELLAVMGQIRGLMIINAYRLGAPHHVVERVLAMAEDNDHVTTVTNFIYGSGYFS